MCFTAYCLLNLKSNWILLKTKKLKGDGGGGFEDTINIYWNCFLWTWLLNYGDFQVTKKLLCLCNSTHKNNNHLSKNNHKISKQNYFNFNWTFWGSESRYGGDRKSWNIRFYRIFCGFVVNGSWSNLWNGVGESRQSNVIHSSSENRDDTVLDLAEIYLTFSIIYSFNIQWISIGPEKPRLLGYFIYH